MNGMVDILARIAVIEREILNPKTGLPVYAYDNIPYTLNMGQCPCFINFPGQLTGNTLDGSDEVGREFFEVRNFNLAFYLDPMGTGISGEKTGDLVPYFDLVYNTFGKYPRLDGLAEIQDSVLVGDTGVSQINFLDTTYFGIRFSLKVTRLVRRLLSNRE